MCGVLYEVACVFLFFVLFFVVVVWGGVCACLCVFTIQVRVCLVCNVLCVGWFVFVLLLCCVLECVCVCVLIHMCLCRWAVPYCVLCVCVCRCALMLGCVCVPASFVYKGVCAMCVIYCVTMCVLFNGFYDVLCLCELLIRFGCVCVVDGVLYDVV